MYKITFEGQQIDLPNYNLSIAKSIEGLDQLEGDIEFKLKSIYDFIGEIIGAEKTNELLGEFYSADPNLINILFLTIVSEFNRPLDEHNIAQGMKTLNDPRFKTAVEAIDKTQGFVK